MFDWLKAFVRRWLAQPEITSKYSMWPVEEKPTEVMSEENRRAVRASSRIPKIRRK